MSIPPHVILRPFSNLSEALEYCPSLGSAFQGKDTLNFHDRVDDFLLVARLLAEHAKGGDSWFWRYFRVLPVGYPSILSNEEEQVQCFAGTPAAVHVKRRFERNRAKVAVVKPCALDGSEETARWAKNTADTRTYETEGPGRPRFQLVPFADIFNHGLNASASWGLDSVSDSFLVAAQAAVAAGSEVLISYGPKENMYLLAKYGFVLPENPHDTVNIYVREGSPFDRSAPPALSLELGMDDIRDFERALRPLELFRHDFSEASSASDEKLRRREVEVAMFNALEERCQHVGTSWGGAADDVPGHNSWLCGGYRAGIASLAGACADFARAAIEELEGRVVLPAERIPSLRDRVAAGLFRVWREAWR